MEYITKLYSEILNQVRESKTREEKIDILTKNKNDYMATIFRLVYSDLDSPYRNNIPKYKPDDSPEGMSYTNLHNEIPRLKFFYNTKFLIADKKFRDKKLRNILEMMHFSEAALLENVINKKLDVYGIDKSIVLDVYPELKPYIG